MIAKKINNALTCGLFKTKAEIGALVALIKEESEDILARRATNNQTQQQIAPIGKDKATVMPKKVATALPPLNFSQIGKQWPSRAPIAAN